MESEGKVDMARIRREQIRWTLIIAMDNARPNGVHEQVLLQTIQAIYPDATALEIRRELDYLEDRKLCEIRKQPSGPWFGNLTRHGVDFREYTIEGQPGIARPVKYW